MRHLNIHLESAFFPPEGTALLAKHDFETGMRASHSSPHESIRPASAKSMRTPSTAIPSYVSLASGGGGGHHHQLPSDLTDLYREIQAHEEELQDYVRSVRKDRPSWNTTASSNTAVSDAHASQKRASSAIEPISPLTTTRSRAGTTTSSSSSKAAGGSVQRDDTSSLRTTMTMRRLNLKPDKKLERLYRFKDNDDSENSEPASSSSEEKKKAMEAEERRREKKYTIYDLPTTTTTTTTTTSAPDKPLWTSQYVSVFPDYHSGSSDPSPKSPEIIVQAPTPTDSSSSDYELQDALALPPPPEQPATNEHAGKKHERIDSAELLVSPETLDVVPNLKTPSAAPPPLPLPAKAEGGKVARLRRFFSTRERQQQHTPPASTTTPPTPAGRSAWRQSRVARWRNAEVNRLPPTAEAPMGLRYGPRGWEDDWDPPGMELLALPPSSSSASSSSGAEEIDLLDFLAQTAAVPRPRAPLSFSEEETAATGLGIEMGAPAGAAASSWGDDDDDDNDDDDDYDDDDDDDGEDEDEDECGSSAMAVVAGDYEEKTRANGDDDDDLWNARMFRAKLGFLEEQRRRLVTLSWPADASRAACRREFVKLNPNAARMHKDRLVDVDGTEILMRSGTMRKTERNLAFLSSERECASEPDCRQLGEPEVDRLAELWKMRRRPAGPSALGLRVLQWVVENEGGEGLQGWQRTWRGGGLDDLPAVKEGEPLEPEENLYEGTRLRTVRGQMYGTWLGGIREEALADGDGVDDEWDRRSLWSLESVSDSVFNTMRRGGSGSTRAVWTTYWDPRGSMGQKIEAWKDHQETLTRKREKREAAGRGKYMTIGGPRYEEIEALDAPLMGKTLSEWWRKSGMGSLIRTPSTDSLTG